MHRSPSRSLRGFTVLELLVVIAIVAVIAGLLTKYRTVDPSEIDEDLPSEEELEELDSEELDELFRQNITIIGESQNKKASQNKKESQNNESQNDSRSDSRDGSQDELVKGNEVVIKEDFNNKNVQNVQQKEEKKRKESA